MLEHIHTVLVIAAHPDDEMLGCAGSLARLRATGAEIAVLLLGEGPTAREENGVTGQTAQFGAHASARAAAATLGIRDVRFADFPDNRFDTVPLLHIVQIVEAVAQDVRPDLVLTHFGGDLNVDHQITHRAAMTAFRPLPGGKPMLVLGFEILSSTEYASLGMAASFHPSVYIDITDFLAVKQKALASYASEMRPWPHPRSHETVDHLARLRGSQCGKEAAEAFMLCRGVF